MRPVSASAVHAVVVIDRSVMLGTPAFVYAILLLLVWAWANVNMLLTTWHAFKLQARVPAQVPLASVGDVAEQQLALAMLMPTVPPTPYNVPFLSSSALGTWF
jgi:hypothetical protein